MDKRFWSTQTTLNIPEDAEVWSKPDKIDEIYGYTVEAETSIEGGNNLVQ